MVMFTYYLNRSIKESDYLSEKKANSGWLNVIFFLKKNISYYLSHDVDFNVLLYECCLLVEKYMILKLEDLTFFICVIFLC